MLITYSVDETDSSGCLPRVKPSPKPRNLNFSRRTDPHPSPSVGELMSWTASPGAVPAVSSELLLAKDRRP